MEPTLEEKLTELLDLYAAGLMEQRELLLLLLALPQVVGGLAWALRADRLAEGPADPRGVWAWLRRDGPIAVLLGSGIAGLLVALGKPSVFDDAYISFRYARHLADGHGLVWNVGERVEGYTNFLWTLLLGLLDWATPLDPLHWALLLTPLIFAANLAVVFAIGRRLRRRDDGQPGAFLPVAVVLVALHSVFTTYGTTGMETGLAILLVLLGAYFLVAREDPLGGGLAGGMLILAALTRPDHGLLYGVGGVVLLGSRVPTAWRARAGGAPAFWREAGRHLAAYAAPLSVYLLYLGWKLAYYGQILPNTYYAKSAYLTWWDQGALYAAMFLAGTHGWVLVLCFLGSLLSRRLASPARRLQWFVLGSLATYGVYVVRVGGDFMYGRFLLVLVPLLALGAEIWLHELAAHALRRRRFPVEALFVLGGLLATLPHLSFIEPRGGKWGIVDEHLSYPIKDWQPFTVGHVNFRTGQFWKEHLADRGIDDAVLTTGSIGMVGYYSELPLVDVRGLTDATVAHTEAEDRGKPGHEKLPPEGYLLERGVHFGRMSSEQGRFHPPRYRNTARIRLGRMQDAWQIIHYDRDLMRELAAEVPELQFIEFEGHLDRYIADLPTMDPERVEADLAWFRRYYFDHNDDPERLAAIEDWLAESASTSLP